MNILNSAEFAKEIMKFAGPTKTFQPQTYYDAHSDSLEFVLRPDDFYAERVDQLVTVYYSRETGEIIGSFLKGVGSLLKKNPGLKILIQENGRVRLAHILVARIAMERSELNGPVTVVYNRLIQQSEANAVEFELCSAAN